MDISMIATWLKRLGGVCLGFLIFWHVTQHSAPQRGRAVVQVPDSDVLVLVDHQEFVVPTLADGPVTCDLEPGRHKAQVWQHGNLMGEEAFIVVAGEEVVVSPYDPAAHAVQASSGPGGPIGDRTDAGGLASRIHRNPRDAMAN